MKKWLLITLILTTIGASWYIVKELGIESELKHFIQPENLKNWIEQFGIFAPIVFMVIYYFLVLAFVSAAAFTILAGILFGKLWGSIYVIIAATLAAQTGFFISRALGSEKLAELKNKKGIGKFIKLLEEKSEHHGFRNLFILRCLFLPYMPLSYAAGIIKKVRPTDFLWATLLTNLIFSPAFVFFGDSLLKGPKALILPLVLICVVLLVPKIVKYFQKHNTHSHA